MGMGLSMMRAGFILLLTVGFIAAASAAAPAREAYDEDSIETIAQDGDLIVLASGGKYDVAVADQATAALWQEGDDVLVCGRTIIDKDQGNERIKVREH
jgi:hypothetical protein